MLDIDLNNGDTLVVAEVSLLKWHGEGQRPYASLIRRQPHADSIVRHIETWLAKTFREPHAVAAAVAEAGILQRTLMRRFKVATGSALIDYVQNLRVEEAKPLLDTECLPTDEVAASVGYENEAFFRRLFKRSTGLTLAEYRRMFQPLTAAACRYDRQHGGARLGGCRTSWTRRFASMPSTRRWRGSASLRL